MNYRTAKKKFEKEYLVDLLTKTKGNVPMMAEKSGLDRCHLYRKFKDHKLKPETYRVK